MSSDSEYKKALRAMLDQEIDRLIDQGIPPQPDNEAYTDRLAQSIQEHAIPELIKDRALEKQLYLSLLNNAASDDLLEIARTALQKGGVELASALEEMAVRRKFEEWILEETKALEKAGAESIRVGEVVKNVRSKHPSNLDQEQLEPIAQEVMRIYFGPPSERRHWMDRT